jgi:hypothetical protein
MFSNTALSTYNYNAILDSRSKQNIPSNIHEFNVSSTYGGECSGVANAAAGIAGHNFLVQHKGRSIADAGLEVCSSYNGRPFITTRETLGDNAQISLFPSSTTEPYNVLIDWGDGTIKKYL